MMGNEPVWSEKILLMGWKDTNALFVFFIEGGWLDRGLNSFGGPVVLVLLAEVTQVIID